MLTDNDIENYLKDDLVRKFGNAEGSAIVSCIMHWWSVKKLVIEGWPELVSIKNRILNHEPVQYVAGWADFAGMKLQVNRSVLIPRPETEELVFLIKEKLHAQASANFKALDIGTGSGCIALALKIFFPLWNVSACDVSTEALQTARINAFINKLEIEFLKKDILISRSWSEFDLIVSNPPYITLDEKQEMQASVAEYEPTEALFVNSEDPLHFYKRIIGLCMEGLLRRGGSLFFEVHYRFGALLPDYMMKHGFRDVQLLKDLSGNFRFVHGVYA